MNFIQYNPANEPPLADEDSPDEMDIENITHEYGNIETLIDFVTAQQIRVTRMEDVIEDIILDIQALDVSKKTQTYKKYNADQIERFIRIMQEEGLCQKLQKLVELHVVQHINFKTNLMLEMERFYQETYQRNQASKYTIERDAQRTIDLRYDIINKWKEAGVDYQRNCVFIDEAGFNSQLIRSRAWSKVGTPAKVLVNTQKGVNISIAPFGTVDFSKVEPLKKTDAAKIEKEFHSEPNSKKRKKALTQEATTPKPLRKGTTAYHIVKFMESVLNILLDKHDKKVDLIHSRGYKPLFMPPYSPFLNPIECWSKIKQNIQRNPLKKGDELKPRIVEACKTVTVEDCQGWIRHAETYWDRCLNKEIGLK
ncbi:hypothetical protein INT46_001996 [Mucor plumbeus]|uniref:Tc1-like transposase DDE domain-containing protein n=1 Tax=Mucor plumbeus TaxID=97098 RepID=A0A8H7QN95_9FUNG|nr:hypothetical protein INT46_001996 [Mucor plumbeus]